VALESRRSLYYYPAQTFEQYLKNSGIGINVLRAGRICQPRALIPQDILADGRYVLCDPGEGFNGDVLVCLSSDFEGGWLKIPARIPLALFHKEDTAPDGCEDGLKRTKYYCQPAALKPGDIIGNGDEVLALPSRCRDEVSLVLTGGKEGHCFPVPACIPIALLTDEDNAPEGIWAQAREWRARHSRMISV
jgi:hypothetical protein